MRMYGFVLEQTLGHGAHSQNLRRALLRETEIDATVVQLDFQATSPFMRRVPFLSNWSLRASAAARAAVRKRLRHGRLDALFVHTQTASLLLGRVMRAVPTIVSLDATPKNFDAVGDWYGHRRGIAAVENAKTAIHGRVLRAAEELVVWCRWAADSLVSDYGIAPQRIHVIPPGVDLDLFHPASRRAPDGPVRVLFVGGDFRRKGGNDLLTAMTMVDAAEIDIVTADPQIQVPDGVTCRIHRGLAPQSDELLRLYANADMFALPSRSDCLPQALAEAAASGLPIVTTRVGAMTEIVADGTNGLVVEPGQPHAIAAALRTLTMNPELRARFGVESRRVAVESHDANHNNGEIFKLLDAAARRREVDALAINTTMASA